MLHHAHDHDQVDHQHQDHRNNRGLKERIRIPDRVIRWQTVTVVIPVSYTHLDVYKRQTIFSLIPPRAAFIAFAVPSSLYVARINTGCG